jgi:hypothetical protein
MSNAPEARPSPDSLGEAVIAFSLIATIVTVTLNGVLFLLGVDLLFPRGRMGELRHGVARRPLRRPGRPPDTGEARQ